MGWRLLLFGVVMSGVAAAVLLVVPGSVTGGAAAVLAGGLVAGWTLLGMEGRGPAALGFHTGPEAPGEMGRGLLLGVAVGLLAVMVLAAAGGVVWSLEEGTVGAYLASAVRSLALFLLPAAAEEAVFRGYPLQALAEVLGNGAALLVTSVGFGLLHLANPGAGWAGVLSVTSAGLFLGALVLRTGSLWWATGAHLGWNWAHGFLADAPVSGLDLVDAPYVEISVAGPELLSGGGFGPEGSPLAAAVMLGAAAWAWWWMSGLCPSPTVARARPLTGLKIGASPGCTA